MDELGSNIVEDTFDFLILDALNDRPLSEMAIGQRTERIHAMLEVAAIRKGQRSPDSLLRAIGRLKSAGYLVEDGGQSNSETIYALTAAGKAYLEEQRVHRQSMLIQFFENSKMHESFGKFLKSSAPRN